MNKKIIYYKLQWIFFDIVKRLSVMQDHATMNKEQS